MALRAERNHPTAFALELEDPRYATAPLVPSHALFPLRLKFHLQLRSNNVLKPLGRDGHVVAARVYLDQLKISSVEIPVKKFIIGFEHPQLWKLIDTDSDLERSSYCYPRLPAFQHIRFHKLIEIAEIRTSQACVNFLLVLRADNVCLVLQSFNKLPQHLMPNSLNTSPGSALLSRCMVCARLMHKKNIGKDCNDDDDDDNNNKPSKVIIGKVRPIE